MCGTKRKIVELSDSDFEADRSKLRTELTDSDPEPEHPTHVADAKEKLLHGSSSGSGGTTQIKISSFKQRFLNWDLLRAELKGICPCGARAKKGQNCYAQFLEPEILEMLKDWRTKWLQIHKIDQDRMLFDKIRTFALEQGQLIDGKPVPRYHLEYNLFGRSVCRDGWCSLQGVGVQPRFSELYKSVKAGKTCPNMDMRFLKHSEHADVTGKRSEVSSYIETLWESVAETLPEHVGLSDKPSDKKSDLEALQDHTTEVVELPPAILPEFEGGSVGSDDVRSLPPGSVYEHWRTFADTYPPGCGYKLFLEVWKNDFGHKLDFRGSMQHAVCTVCMQHKLLLRELRDDVNAFIRQRRLYDRHLTSQYNDRRCYWYSRAQSRLRGCTITLIIDAMDQAKFAWPRAAVFFTHFFDGFHRPKLHVVSCIVHGYFSLYAVSHNDLRKSGSNTAEVLAIVFEKLKYLGVDLSSIHLNVQMDNAANQNKNNTVFLFLATLVLAGKLASATISFLRTAHTHEDVDRDFSSLAKYIMKELYLDTIQDFVAAIGRWLKGYNRPHEPNRYVVQLDQHRDWKHWLLDLDMQIVGIFGPTAPHLFMFVPRAGLQHVN